MIRIAGERGYTLSGGQRQRIALARALLLEPGVLILDDALSAVDMGVEAAIGAALARRRAGATTLLIAHRLSTISLADRVVFTEGGRVVATGTHAELMAAHTSYVQVLADAEAREAETREAQTRTAETRVAEGRRRGDVDLATGGLTIVEGPAP